MISDDHHLVFLQVLLLIGDGDDGHWPMIINQRGVENHDHHDKRKVRLGAMACTRFSPHTNHDHDHDLDHNHHDHDHDHHDHHDHRDKRKVRLGAMAGGILPRAPSIVQPLLIII